MSTFRYALGTILTGVTCVGREDLISNAEKLPAAGAYQALCPESIGGDPSLPFTQAHVGKSYRLPARWTRLYGSQTALRALADQHGVGRSVRSRKHLIEELIERRVELPRSSAVSALIAATS